MESDSKLSLMQEQLDNERNMHRSELESIKNSHSEELGRMLGEYEFSMKEVANMHQEEKEQLEAHIKYLRADFLERTE